MSTVHHNGDDLDLDLVLMLLEHIDARTAEVELLTSKDIIDAFEEDIIDPFEEDYFPQHLKDLLDTMASAGLLTSDPDFVNLTTLGRTFLYVAEDRDLVQKVRDRLGDCSLSELVTALTGDGSESAKDESKKEETKESSSAEAEDDSEPIYIASTDFTETEPQAETELNAEPTAKKSWLSRLFGLFQRQSSKEYFQKMSQDEYWVIAKKHCYSIPSIVEHLYETGKFSYDPNNLWLWKPCYEILRVEKSVLVQYLRAKRMNPWFLVVLTARFDASPSFWKKVWKNRPDSCLVDFLPHFDYDPFVITEMLVNLALDIDIFEVQYRGIHTDCPLLTSHFSLLVENDLVLVKEVDIPPEEYAFGPAGYYRVSGPTVLLLGLSPRGESVVNALTRPGCLERAAKASRGKPFEYFVKYVEDMGNGRR